MISTPETEKTKRVPFPFFGTPPNDLDEYLDEKLGEECDGITLALARTFHVFVDRNATIQIHEIHPYAGITEYVSLQKLVKKSRYSRSSIKRGLLNLIQCGAIEKLDQNARQEWRYKLNWYEPAHENSERRTS